MEPEPLSSFTQIMRENKYYKKNILALLMEGINSFVNLNGYNLLCNK